MIDSLLQVKKPEFEKVLTHFETELNSLRTGRAHPALLSMVKVESYGSFLPLEHVASITVSDAKTLTVSPWDKSQLSAIEKAILQANVGMNPSSDGQVIRLLVPPLNEERRRELVKLLGQLAEQARIGIRQVREEVHKAMKRAKDDSEISADEFTRGQKKLQELIDKYNDIIKTASLEKEKDLLTV